MHKDKDDTTEIIIPPDLLHPPKPSHEQNIQVNVHVHTSNERNDFFESVGAFGVGFFVIVFMLFVLIIAGPAVNFIVGLFIIIAFFCWLVGRDHK